MTQKTLILPGLTQAVKSITSILTKTSTTISQSTISTSIKSKVLPIQTFFKEKVKPFPDSSYLLRPDYKPTRYPVVLCHGLYGFDKIGFELLPQLQIHYWQGVAEALQKMGMEVIVAKVSSTGSVEERALQLHNILNQTLPGRKVNLIGHSMGGLDGRYLISSIPDTKKKYQVVSLTTVSTPHRGSSFMDWCRDNLKVGRVGEVIGDKSKEQAWFERIMAYIDAPAYSHLTTTYARENFNKKNLDRVDVAYYSYAAYLDKMSVLSALHFPWTIIEAREGRNDGLVSIESAKWGQLVETVKANHFDLVVRFRWFNALGKAIGYKDGRYELNPKLSLPKPILLSPESEFDNVEFYLRMSTFLNNQGF